ncbi:MAG: MarR family transcriptional regulator [Microthrixaceae bacterium]
MSERAVSGSTGSGSSALGGFRFGGGSNRSVSPTVGLLGSIVRLNLVVTDVLEQIVGSFGVAMPDYLVLGVIRGAPGSRTSPSVITEVLGRTSGGMTLTLDRLVNAGLVKRSKDPDDGRRVVVELTEPGLELALQVNRALHNWEESLSLDQPVEEVADMVDALTQSIGSHSVLH